MPDVHIGWFVIPGAVASLGAIWAYLEARNARSHASRLRRDEESFRLTQQSPRVNAAAELWSAFCEYERTLVALGQAEAVLSEEIRQASEHLTAALDRAEALLPNDMFRSFDALFRAYNAVRKEHSAASALAIPIGLRAIEKLQAVEALRPPVVRNIRALLGSEPSSRSKQRNLFAQE
jgi:hypothetical protein